MIIVEIAGFLGADPEERFTATGKRVVSMRVATRLRKGGQDVTVWWRVSIWGDRFDRMLTYLKKGSSVIVIGEMGEPETYVGKDGVTRISLNLTAEIIKFSPFGKPDTQMQSQAPAQLQEQPQAAPSANLEQEQFATQGAGVEQENHFTGDDLPF